MRLTVVTTCVGRKETETGGNNVPIDQTSCPSGHARSQWGLIAAVSAAGQSMEGKEEVAVVTLT
jgi:hypothetical protein